MLVVDHDKIIHLSTHVPSIPMLGKNCCYNVIVFYVGNKRCCIIILYCIVLYCIVVSWLARPFGTPPVKGSIRFTVSRATSSPVGVIFFLSMLRAWAVLNGLIWWVIVND